MSSRTQSHHKHQRTRFTLTVVIAVQMTLRMPARPPVQEAAG